MGKVYGLHVLRLKSGANIEEFEQFFKNRVASVRVPGMQAHLLRGDRGKDAGKYVQLFEIDTVEARDRLFPTAGEVPPELAEAYGQAMQGAARWLDEGPDEYTDWVMVA